MEQPGLTVFPGKELIMAEAGSTEEKNPKQGHAIPEKQKKDLLAKSEVSLILDNYDDIFSDFDPRPYSARGLSEDFLHEARNAMKFGKEGASIELRFMIPKALRNLEQESLIRKRLKEHFKKHFHLMEKEKNRKIRNGAIIAFAGFAIILVAAFIATLESKDLFTNFIFVVLEPSGWFAAWSGLDTVFFRSKETDSEIVFYKKMGKAEAEFIEY